MTRLDNSNSKPPGSHSHPTALWLRLHIAIRSSDDRCPRLLSMLYLTPGRALRPEDLSLHRPLWECLKLTMYFFVLRDFKLKVRQYLCDWPTSPLSSYLRRWRSPLAGTSRGEPEVGACRMIGESRALWHAWGHRSRAQYQSASPDTFASGQLVELLRFSDNFACDRTRPREFDVFAVD